MNISTSPEVLPYLCAVVMKMLFLVVRFILLNLTSVPRQIWSWSNSDNIRLYFHVSIMCSFTFPAMLRRFDTLGSLYT